MGELTHLRTEIVAWAARRRGADGLGQHATQLASLESTLLTALSRLDDLVSDHPGNDLHATYDYYRGLDRQVTLVRRLWRWFADKYDQRDVEPGRTVLPAADEVVWAVHAEAHRAAGAQSVPPAPLPFLEEVETPEAVPRDEPLRELRPDRFDDVLAAALARLPVPVVGLPTAVAATPWMLVLLGHEVGHHLLYDLAPARQLVGDVGVRVQAAVGGAAGQRWRAWSQEEFADLSGLVSMGPALIPSLLPYELGGERHLLDRGRGRYPAPVVRFALLAQMCRLLQIGSSPELGDADAATWTAPRADDPLGEQRAAVRADLQFVPTVAKTLVELDLAGLGTLAELVGLDTSAHGPDGRISRRAQALLDGNEAHETGLEVVRELTAAAVQAWRTIQQLPGPGERQERCAQLAARFLELVVASREPGTRAVQDRAEGEPDDALVHLLAAPPALAEPAGGSP